jgi:hypothetical protein
MLEMQKFHPTDNFPCVEDAYDFDACVIQASLDGSPCTLPFQHLFNNLYQTGKTCQTLAEGWEAFQLFQLAPLVCRTSCIQMNTIFSYYMPQYLRTQYFNTIYRIQVQPMEQVIPYYLFVPSTVKVSTASPSYGFISLIAEVAGWYNLFLGGSVLAMWEFLGFRVLCILVKLQVTLLKMFSKTWKFSFFLVFICILFYILLNCITMLMKCPVGTRISLTNSLNKGLCISICLPQFTLVYNPRTLTSKDIANSTSFWDAGNNLSNKVSDINVITSEGDILNLWSWNQPTQASNLFHVFNVISSDQAVDFCHTLDLSTISSTVSEVHINAVNDLTIAVHLAGQLLTTHAKYGIANNDTITFDTKNELDVQLYESRVSILVEETSLQMVNSLNCENYNDTWTYDDCILSQALKEFHGKRSLLYRLLRPNVSTVINGINSSVLQTLFSALSAEKVEINCPVSCRSIVVSMRPEIGVKLTRPNHSIDWPTYMPPLPPMLMKVNLEFSDLSRVNEVRFLQSGS